MRHLISGRKLNRTASHRKAMLANLAQSILDKERVTTTVAKAKEVRGVVERLISYGKKGTLHAIRLAARHITSKDVLKKLFDDIAPSFKERDGGYTRVVKLKNRKGDNAELAIIELVGREGDIQRKRKKKKKAVSKKGKSTTAVEAKNVTDVEDAEVIDVVENDAVEGSEASSEEKVSSEKNSDSTKKAAVKKTASTKAKKETKPKKTEKE